MLISLIALSYGTEILVYGPAAPDGGPLMQRLEASYPSGDGHSVDRVSETTWRNMTALQFQQYDVLVIGDPDCGGPTASQYTALWDTRNTWGPIVRGNIVLAGTDAACHYPVNPSDNDAGVFFDRGVAWAANGDATGLYVSSDWGKAVAPDGSSPGYGTSYLSGIGNLQTIGTSGDWMSIEEANSDHPVLTGILDPDNPPDPLPEPITDQGMSQWHTSFHAYWRPGAAYPNDFRTLVHDGIRPDDPLQEDIESGTRNIIVVRDQCDWDRDGFDSAGTTCGGTDCDDYDADVNPEATEICDGIDNDCNEGIDEASAIGSQTWYRDFDNDGYGDPSQTLDACEQPTRYVAIPGDCRDDLPNANPLGTEVPYDGIDNDCTGGDECDVDNDGFDFDNVACGGDDCDDDNPAVNTDATEIWYDGPDRDCDGLSDYDQDRDGHDSDQYGGDDCDDLDDTVHPGAIELQDGKDNNCNGWREDIDTDGDGVFDEDEWVIGTDPEDADSDGDGVPDAIEIGSPSDPLDSDNDDVIDALDSDDDDDGIPTSVEIGDYDWENGDTLPNTDGDGLPDHRDRDADGDGFRDEDEGVVDSDGDGVGDWQDTDSDDDGVLDADERDGDTDGDGTHDRLDDDDDDDGLPTSVESAWSDPDVDDDTVANWLDDDSDSDGARDEIELDGDLDGDGIPNYVDPDDLDGPAMQPDRILRGGSCNQSGGAPTGAFLLLGLLLLRRRR